MGKYMGQSTGLVSKINADSAENYKHVVVIDNSTEKAVMLDDIK